MAGASHWKLRLDDSMVLTMSATAPEACELTHAWYWIHVGVVQNDKSTFRIHDVLRHLPEFDAELIDGFRELASAVDRTLKVPSFTPPRLHFEGEGPLRIRNV